LPARPSHRSGSRVPPLNTLRLAAAAVLALSAAIAASRPAIPDAGRTALSRFLRAAVARGDVPAVVAIVAGPDRVLYVGAFGKQSVAANIDATPDTIFRIASMTKPVTSLAAMMLVESGAIELDDPVTKYLPNFRQPPVLIRFDENGAVLSRPARRAIVVRDLLTNTSGIGYAFSDPSLARLNAAGTPEAELPLLHDPGAKWTYGSSTGVLGRVIERASGTTLDAFYKARIFDPLGMTDTFYVVPPDKQDRVVTQHARDAGGVRSERPNIATTLQSAVRGDGGLFSTARDYARFMQVFLNSGRYGGGRLVSDRTIALMTSNQIGRLTVGRQPAANAALTAPFPIGAGKDKFGFGFQIEAPPVTRGMRSAGSLSWGGIYNTHFWIDPRRQMAAAVLMQVLPFYDEASLKMLRGFERLVYQKLQ
jgi:CubicO group peptidase (beta-lactamase class C family)